MAAGVRSVRVWGGALVSAVMVLAALGVGGGGAALAGSQLTVLYPLVSETFQGNSVGSNWTLPAIPSEFGTNTACLTEGGTPSAPSNVPQCSGASDTNDSGSLRLTTNAQNQIGTVFYNGSFLAEEGLVVEFDSYSFTCSVLAGPLRGTYNGGLSNGYNCVPYVPGNGLTFLLAAVNPTDPAPPSAGSNPGGSMGYGPYPTNGYDSPGTPLPGLSDAYMGVGLDVYGDYLNPQYNLGTSSNWTSNTDSSPPGCPFYSADPLSSGQYPEEVTIKGPGDGLTGYCPIQTSYSSSSGYSIQLDQSATPTRPTTPVPVQVVLNPGSAPVVVDGLNGATLSVPAHEYSVSVQGYCSTSGGTQVCGVNNPPLVMQGALPTLDAANDYGGLPASWVNPATELPYRLTFGLAATTGGATEVHEITDLVARTIYRPALGLALTDNSEHVLTPGKATTFTFTPSVSDLGGAEYDNLVLSGTFPQGVTPDVSATSGLGWTCASGATAESFQCTYATPLTGLQPGTTVQSVSIPATLSSSAATGPFVVEGSLSSADATNAPVTAQDTLTVLAPTSIQTPAPTVPPTHTGEPWAGDVGWEAGVAALIVGGGGLIVAQRRRMVH